MAQAPKPVTKATTVKATATVQAIDSTRRIITLRTANGEEDSFQVGPEVVRFNELKVGDKINITYIQSLVVSVQKPGTAAKSTTASGALVTAGGAKPGATLSGQATTTVTVKAIDASVPSITVVTDDGRTVTRKIEDKKNLEGIKVGDKLDLTYTEAVVMTAEAAK
jgi:hypothetical protein